MSAHGENLEQLLEQDPTGVFAGMDVASRESYLRAVCDIARLCGCDEMHVAEAAVAHSVRSGGPPITRHVGYYLVDAGRASLEAALGLQPSRRRRLGQLFGQHRLICYAGSVTLVSAILAAAMLAFGQLLGRDGINSAVLFLLATVAISELAYIPINRLVTTFIRPHRLARMSLSNGVPPEASTIVAVPTVLRGPSHIDRLLATLESNYLANNGTNIYFALLSDWSEARTEVLPNDEALLAYAVSGVSALNRRYGSRDDGPIFLFHRPRRWSESERAWMGHERKRGKLTELNRLLRTHARDGFCRILGDTKALSNIRYVITLDEDTKLPAHCARLLIATMEHPLNKPLYDPRAGRVVRGYGMLQPRINLTAPSETNTIFSRIFAGSGHVVLPVSPVSDIGQDLFGEGGFAGKGIYDIAAVEQSVRGRFPEDRVLSHDYLEGAYARAGRVTDLVVCEEGPTCYVGDAAKWGRWARGDWQNARWLLPTVPVARNRKVRNRLPALWRWRIFDFLRRLMVKPALLALLLLGWAIQPGSAGRWTALVAAITAGPELAPLVNRFLSDVPSPPGSRKRAQFEWRRMFGGLNPVLLGLLTLTFLPYEACIFASAAGRVAWRLLVSRRRLFEWIPAGEEQEQCAKLTLHGHFMRMWFSPVLAVVAGTGLAITVPASLIAILPMLILWLFAPAIAWLVSRPIVSAPS